MFYERCAAFDPFDIAVSRRRLAQSDAMPAAFSNEFSSLSDIGITVSGTDRSSMCYQVSEVNVYF